MKITCESFLQQIVPFLENELSKSQMEAMADHVEACHNCAELAASLGDIHLDSQIDLIGKQTQKNELQPDFWSGMNTILDAELNKNFETEIETHPKNSQSDSKEKNTSIFLIETQDQENSISLQSKQEPTSNDDSREVSTNISDIFPVQSRRIENLQSTTLHFREMILAALCLVFLLWGYQQQQQNVALEHKLQMQNIEIQHLRISIEKRPNSPQKFQDPYAIPANYVPSRLDL